MFWNLEARVFNPPWSSVPLTCISDHSEQQTQWHQNTLSKLPNLKPLGGTRLAAPNKELPYLPNGFPICTMECVTTRLVPSDLTRPVMDPGLLTSVSQEGISNVNGANTQRCNSHRSLLHEFASAGARFVPRQPCPRRTG